ncbi:hypothetical protein L226DRAFT_528050 [Lentinus tigrinus ALCF2SS1-7]|uniref:uncharacterized protein n=1 Tax=Lentinus tigrinus ALCF2SS1-7 TaxID=1328758 RepID=UPI0011661281|nr:hypothetical protein L226DRAFT_528050 [Lentinus tigrinus ALCF2SS1-7]
MQTVKWTYNPAADRATMAALQFETPISRPPGVAPRSSDKGKARHDLALDEEIAVMLYAEQTLDYDEERTDMGLGLHTDADIDAPGKEYDWAYNYVGASTAQGFSYHNWAGGHCHCQDCMRSRTPRTYASSSAYKLLPAKVEPARNCVACIDRIEGPVIHAPCGHDYDVDCVVGLFRAATTDESLFPPACCRKPFDFERLRRYMDRELARLFEKKAREFSTQHRVYCSRASCSAFLGAATNSATAMSCDTCGTRTCGHCKKAAHSANQRCTNDADKEILTMANKEGWKQCPRCGLVVELTFGCNHMTCRCNFQFCYLCLAPWKTCECSRWDLDRLLEAEHDPDLLEEAIHNLEVDDQWLPGPRPADRPEPIFRDANANLRRRHVERRRRATDLQVRPARAPTPERQSTWAPVRPPTPRFAPGNVPDGGAEASGSGPSWPPQPAAPVMMPMAAPPGWDLSFTYSWPPQGGFYHPAMFPQRTFCQQHWWTPTISLGANGNMVIGCATCGNWQSGLWMCVYCQTHLCTTCRYHMRA